MNRIRATLLHLKMEYIGSKNFDEDGGGYLPCRKCLKEFYSYRHFFDDYDSLCPDCRFEASAKSHKAHIEKILTDFDSRLITWETAKALLEQDLIDVKFEPFRCAWNDCILVGDEPSMRMLLRDTGKDTLPHKRVTTMLKAFGLKRSDTLCRKCFDSLYSLVRRTEW